MADALTANEDQDEKDEDVEITEPRINEILEDADDMLLIDGEIAMDRNKSDGDGIKKVLHKEGITLNDQPMEQIPGSSSSVTTADLLGVLGQITQPEVRIQCIDVDKSKDSTLIVSDNIEVKKEELEGVKRLGFTEEEDSFIKEGITRYNSSKTKWADILKDPEYKFHPTRTRDTLRVRAKYLKSSNRTRKKPKLKT